MSAQDKVKELESNILNVALGFVLKDTNDVVRQRTKAVKSIFCRRTVPPVLFPDVRKSRRLRFDNPGGVVYNYYYKWQNHRKVVAQNYRD